MHGAFSHFFPILSKTAAAVHTLMLTPEKRIVKEGEIECFKPIWPRMKYTEILFVETDIGDAFR